MIEGISLFNTMTQKMDYLTTRHTLLAQNVSNSDSPGYEAQDLRPFAEAMKSVRPVGVQASHARHMMGTVTTSDFREQDNVSGWEVSPSGNDVTLEAQMIEAADNERDYRLTTNLMQKHVTMLKATLSTRN